MIDDADKDAVILEITELQQFLIRLELQFVTGGHK
jgi:hypothetical protein